MDADTPQKTPPTPPEYLETDADINAPRVSEGRPPSAKSDSAATAGTAPAEPLPKKAAEAADAMDTAVIIDDEGDGAAPVVDPAKKEDSKAAALPAQELLPGHDSKWRPWAILWACFSCSCWAMGMPSVWGIFVRTFVSTGEFAGASTFQLQMAGTLTWGVMVLVTLFVGPLTDYLPPWAVCFAGVVGCASAFVALSFVTQLWQVFLTSTLYGIAGSCIYTPAPGMISAWFTKRRALAMGIFVSGSGIGGFVTAAIAQAAISARGWRFASQVLGAVLFAWLAPSVLFLKRRVVPVKRSGPFIDLSYFRNLTFSLVFACVFVIFFAFFMPNGFIPLMLLDGGYPQNVGAAIVAAYSACMALGRIAGGFFADRVGEINMFVLACLVPFLAVTCIWLPAPTNIATVSVASLTWALFCGSPLVCMPIIAGKEFGYHRLGSAIGVLFLSFGPGELFGNAVLGIIVDQHTTYTATGQRVGADYRPMLGFCSACWGVGLALIYLLRYKKVGWKLVVRI
ncbi:major facilitator superfamily domain-containing protein [Hyaloraphidium curvatum]|nr:major facilitator superfamily domain-containing protein [Hyaloraphidium curvatum]